MKKIFPIALLSLAVPAIAAAEDGFYIGAKFGQVDFKESETYYGVDLEAEGSDAQSLVLGYQIGNFAIEFDAMFSDIEVDLHYRYFDGFTSRTITEREELDYDAFSLYGVYRSEGDLFFKAKAGIIRNEIGNSATSEDEIDFSAGLGGGYRFSKNVSLEAEYTYLDQDANLLSASLYFKF